MNRLGQFLLAAFLGMLGAAQAAADTTVFLNVNVLPMSSDIVLQQQTVVVIDGEIARMGHVDTITVPKDALVVDGTHRFLMPGLAEMHAHVTSTASDEFERLATLFVANGVTTIRGMLGRPDHLELRQQLANGEIFGPRLTTSGPSLNGRSVSSPEDARQQVREQHAAGYDFIKVHPGLSRDEFIAMATTANEIGMPYAGHVPAAAGVAAALGHGMTTIDHLDGYFAALMPHNSDGAGGFGGFFDVMLASEIDASKIAEIAAATAAAGTWNVPTEVLVEQLIDTTPLLTLKNRPENRFVPPATVQDWLDRKAAQLADRNFDPQTAARAVELRRQLILELHRAGAGLLLGSDAPQIFNVPGFAVHRELGALVAAGLTPFEALQTGTTAVATFLQSNTGEVAPGKAADLVLLDANPLTDIRNSRRIHGVMLRGQWLPAAELQQRLSRFLQK